MRDAVDCIGIFPVKPHADRFGSSDGCRVRRFAIGIKRRIVCILQRPLQDGSGGFFCIASALLIHADMEADLRQQRSADHLERQTAVPDEQTCLFQTYNANSLRCCASK